MPKIFIVDDEIHIRMLLEQTLEDLEELGVEINTCADGLEAYNFITKDKPNLVFLDVMLPNMNGFEICKNIKHVDKIQSVYIVMITAKGQEFDKQQGRDVGADLYLTKPFDPDHIVEISKKVLGL